MFTNNWKAAFRSILRNKFYSSISIFGLAIGLTAGILILLWCQDERSYDRSVKGAENIYRAIPNFASNGSKWYFPTVPPALAPLSKHIPGIEKAGRITRDWNERVLKYKDKSFSERNAAYIDPELFAILSVSFTKGAPSLPFLDNHSIVLTEPFAKKYFGTEDPIGKVIERADKKESFTVTGVVQVQHNSQLAYDYFVPFSTLTGADADWLDYDYEMYIRLTPLASTTVVAANLTRLQKANTSDDLTRTLRYSLQPLSTIHLYNPDGSDGLITMVRIFTWVAFVILLIAAINYINLTTAKAAQRAKEIGVRKIIGAGKRQLFFQFIGESSIVFLLATAVSLLLIKLLFPLYNTLTGKELTFDLFDPAILKVIGLTMAVTLSVSAIYPAVLLSSFKPLQAIKGKFSIGRGNHLLRKLLVVSQFGFSIVFIICTIVIGRQLTYIRVKNLGLDKENVFRLELKQ